MPYYPVRRPILGNTDLLLQGVEKTRGPGGKEFPRTYQQAQELLLPQIDRVRTEVSRLGPQKRYPGESVVCLRIHPEFLAKSYDLTTLYALLGNAGVGSRAGVRLWRARPDEVLRTRLVDEAVAESAAELEGRTVFLQLVGEDGFAAVESLLKLKANQLPREALADEFCRIERIDLLQATERVLSFPKDWESGRAELVLHPSRLSQEERRAHLAAVIERAGGDLATGRFAHYPSSGILFASVRLNAEVRAALADYMPVRVVRPLNAPRIDFMRNLGTAPAPQPPPINSPPPRTKVVVFDAGFPAKHALLGSHFAERADLSIASPVSAGGIEHGTAVVGAVMHGALNEVPATAALPAPELGVIGVRVLPPSNPLDFDLYETIDVIEKAVPQLAGEAKVFNISLGPEGPISDDEVSRFTYVLDQLAYKHGIMPVVAVGNDGGNAVPDNRRIQSPSDAVNGLAIGAYTFNKGSKQRAGYGCVGPGREGGKTKPDLLAFSGDTLNPFHAVGVVPGQRLYSEGTSLGAPLGARAVGRLLDRCPSFSPLAARALLTHQAQLCRDPNHNPMETGFGYLCEDIDQLTACAGNSVTAVFEQTLTPGKYLRLDFPLPASLQLDSRVEFTWTIAAIAPVDPGSPLEYTGQSFDYTYHPHKLRHNFRRYADGKLAGDPAKCLHLVEDLEEIEQLKAAGWRQSKLSAARAVNRERDLRKFDFKWDTVVSETVRHNPGTAYAPFIVIHAFERNANAPKLKFAAFVTVILKSNSIDLYQEVRSHYSFLQPIKVRDRQQITA